MGDSDRVGISNDGEIRKTGIQPRWMNRNDSGNRNSG